MKDIKQIIPADGWVAKFKQKDGSVDECPLTCFALIDNDGDTAVEGLYGSDCIFFCEDMNNFIEYEKVR